MSSSGAQLPLSKIRKIAKLHPDCNIINAEAAFVLTVACEKFVGLFAKQAYAHAENRKRKTIQLRDIGMLTDWPDKNVSETGENSGTTVDASTHEVIGTVTEEDGNDVRMGEETLVNGSESVAEQPAALVEQENTSMVTIGEDANGGQQNVLDSDMGGEKEKQKISEEDTEVVVIKKRCINSDSAADQNNATNQADIPSDFESSESSEGSFERDVGKERENFDEDAPMSPLQLPESQFMEDPLN